MKNMKRFVITLTGFLIFCSLDASGERTPAGKPWTYLDLISRLTDLERLATLPAPGEKAAQWSSYNRASHYDEASGQYVNWDTNADGRGIIREEDGRRVLAEMEGPGVIWRMWTATTGWDEDNVRIYLDGSDSPAVDLVFTGYFDRKNEPFTRSALVFAAADWGLNSYIPIPFQKSCKITAGQGGQHYNITYTTYPKDVILPTFKRELSRDESIALDRANDVLASCGLDPAGDRKGQVTERQKVTVAPGETVTVFQLKGTRAITAVKAQLNLPQPPSKVVKMSPRVYQEGLRQKIYEDTPDPEEADALRELALSMFWDGQSQAGVWSPLGDFFGSGPGVNKYKSLPMGMTEDGFYSYWYMPFEKGARLALTNDGNKARTVTFTITHAPLSRPIEHLGRFHAKWHRGAFPPTDPGRKNIDWTLLKVKGRGRLCGVVLDVWNPKGGWWGEGDEKFFVDGEKFPSIYGTGSEDYFGYAWGGRSPQIYHSSYINKTFEDNLGHVSLNRWHITDNVPFQTSFEGAIEKYPREGMPTEYGAIAYWYLAAGQTDEYGTVSLHDRTEGFYVKPTQ